MSLATTAAAAKAKTKHKERSEAKLKKKNEDRNITLAAKGLMDTIYSLDVLRMAAKKKRREKKKLTAAPCIQHPDQTRTTQSSRIQFTTRRPNSFNRHRRSRPQSVLFSRIASTQLYLKTTEKTVVLSI